MAKTGKAGRGRMVAIALGSIVVLVVAVLSFNRASNKPPAKVAPTAQLQTVPNIEAVPGISQAPGYTVLVETNNDRLAQQAQDRGTTTMPTLVQGQTGGALDPIGGQKPATVPVRTARPPTPPPVAAPPAATTQPTRRPVAPGRNAEDQKRSVAGIEAHIAAMRGQWQGRPTFQEFNYTAERPEEDKPRAGNSLTQVAQTSTGRPSGAGSSANQGSVLDNYRDDEKPAAIVQAGSIVPAVLLGPVNSDNPGPVLAQIVAGPLQGARVLGHFQPRREHVVLEFDTLSWPQAGRSMKISAYGVNQDASLGMASDVNNHYFLRYGLTMAAAFVEGYGRAASRANTTVIISPLGLPIEQRGEMTSEQVRRSALGDVGQTLGQQLQREANIPPTITVDANAAIGLLFMADF